MTLNMNDGLAIPAPTNDQNDAQQRNDVLNERKIAVIGCGFVGAASAFALMQTGIFNEIVLVDVDHARAEGEAQDISDGVSFVSPAKVYAGTYEDIKDAAIIVVTAGCAQKDGETRLDLTARNVAIFDSILDAIEEISYNGILLIVSNPVDILTYRAHQRSTIPTSHIIGSGTVLDTSRLKYELSRRLSVDPRSIDAYFLGEHGDSSFIAWSAARVSGVTLNDFYRMRLFEAQEVMESQRFNELPETEIQQASDAIELLSYGSFETFRHDVADSIRNAAYEIISKKKATYYGIAMSVVRIVTAILHDEKTVLPVSNPAFMHDIEGICLSTPCVIGKDGIEGHVPDTLSFSERRYLEKSAEALKSTIEQVGISS